jgi:hypothetical protein
MQDSQQAIRASEVEEMTPIYLRQVPEGTAGLGQAGTSEAAEVERTIFMTAEEMQGEVQEAEAAVDAYYRRQARRAGLGDVLPMGRPMTEKELDELSERLGDGLGARARRREEVERMSLAEMEAELRGVREEIRRRRGMGVGWLPLMLTLICLSSQAVEGFTAYDCSNRSNIVESYSLLEPDACTNMGTVYGVQGNHADQAR